jgi:hypothetical protein
MCVCMVERHCLSSYAAATTLPHSADVHCSPCFKMQTPGAPLLGGLWPACVLLPLILSDVDVHCIIENLV